MDQAGESPSSDAERWWCTRSPLTADRCRKVPPASAQSGLMKVALVGQREGKKQAALQKELQKNRII